MKNEVSNSLLIKEKFPYWCKPKRGTSNPENMTNIVWTELIRSNAHPHAAHETYGTVDKQSPGWCFSRYGQSKSRLIDGRTIYIGGEHEDFYDEDFYIYNDVIVESADGSITIFGYPTDIFPPTDSHTATLVGTNIYIIGCIGYPEQRNYSDTPVFILNLQDFSIRQFKTNGTKPNWLFGHTTKWISKENAIYCESGKIQHVESNETIENISTWRLCLDSGEWTETSKKPWSRWRLIREDNASNKLWQLEQIFYAEKTGRNDKYSEEYKAELLQKSYPLNSELYESRYTPPLKHRNKSTDEYNRFLIVVDGVTVRYEQSSYDITVTVEGALPEDKILILKSHGIEVFSELEATPYKLIEF
jgi:hypothetical protein